VSLRSDRLSIPDLIITLSKNSFHPKAFFDLKVSKIRLTQHTLQVNPFFMMTYHKVITEQEIFKRRVSSCSGADCKHLGEGRKIEFHNVGRSNSTTSKVFFFPQRQNENKL
jgi:hypothetical protein